MYTTDYDKAVIAGGSGLIGRAFIERASHLFHRVILLSRSQPDFQLPANAVYLNWDATHIGPWVESLEGADLLLNLCGRSVDCRYTAKNRKEILRSRTVPTTLLSAAIHGLAVPPALWINASSATYYADSEVPQTEGSGQAGEGFSVEIVKAWEAAFFQAEHELTRKVALRTSFVFDDHSAALSRLQLLARTGMSGVLAGRDPFVSWIHSHDLIAILLFILRNPGLDGALNAAAPQPLRMTELMNAIRNRQSHVPCTHDFPKWMLELGSLMLQTETELILKSRCVVPDRLLKSGFQFKYPSAPDALNDLIAPCAA